MRHRAVYCLRENIRPHVHAFRRQGYRLVELIRQTGRYRGVFAFLRFMKG